MLTADVMILLSDITNMEKIHLSWPLYSQATFTPSLLTPLPVLGLIKVLTFKSIQHAKWGHSLRWGHSIFQPHPASRSSHLLLLPDAGCDPRLGITKHHPPGRISSIQTSPERYLLNIYSDGNHKENHQRHFVRVPSFQNILYLWCFLNTNV